MLGPGASTAFTPALAFPIIAFVVAAEAATAVSQDDDFIFGDLEGLQDTWLPEEVVNEELVEEVVGEILQINGNSGVGSPEVRKYVDTWSPAGAPIDSKEAQLRVLAEKLYQRRPVLYLKGHAQPYPAQVLLRTVRKPSVGALTAAATAAGLFKSPSNTFIVIKFDPQFGYADIIVDPFFTDAFIQQPSTATYSKLLSELPRAFVGTAPELRRMVALLTQQSIHAYEAKGATCPPWRRFDAMLARWLPKRFTDEVITIGTVNSSVHTAAPELLLRSDSTSSSTSTDSSEAFVLSSTFGNTASSVPRTIVHGFDIPVKTPSTVPEANTADLATVEAVTAPQTTADADLSSTPADATVFTTAYVQQYNDSVAAKASAVSATESSDAAAAAGSWQLTTDLLLDDADNTDISMYNNDDRLIKAALKPDHSTAEGDVPASTVVPPAATARLHLPGQTAYAAPAAVPVDNPADRLLAAAGYSTRFIKLAYPAATAAAGVHVASNGDSVVGSTAAAAIDNGPVCNNLKAGGQTLAGGCYSVVNSSSSDIGSKLHLAGQGVEGLAQAMLKIRSAVMCAPVSASGLETKVPVVGGRKVVRLDFSSGAVHGCRADSARAA